MYRTFILLKPDCVWRNLSCQILGCFEFGFRIDEIKMFTMTDDQASRLYEKFADKDFFQSLKDYMTSGRSIAAVLTSRSESRIVEIVRGAALSLRIMHQLDFRRNTIHSSDSPEAAEREIRIFFGDT